MYQRFRLASFTVESTRYVKYDELTVIQPSFNNRPNRIVWKAAMEDAEYAYRKLVNTGEPPEIARSVLPQCTATTLYMTANLRELRHILKLRTDKAAHLQMRLIMNQVLDIMREKLPVVVEDIGNDD